MSVKKEMLNALTEQQLKKLAENKGIKFKLNKIQKQYYSSWDERDKIIDLMSDKEALSIKEIEDFIKLQKNSDF